MHRFLCAIAAIFCCEVRAQAPVISNIAPESAPVGASVTITGSGFNPVAANNIVRFGSVKAVVNAAAATQLVVEVPAGAKYAPVSVTVGGLSAFSTRRFSTAFSAPDVATMGPFKEYFVMTSPTDRPYSVAIDDMDVDGRPDVIVGYGYGNLSIFRNQTTLDGAITFGDGATRLDMLSVGSINPAIYVGTGDLDGDGKPDLIAARYADDIVTVFRNTSVPGILNGSSFAAGVDVAVTNPVNPVVADIDLDGKPEIIVPNAITNKISVIRNTNTPGAIVSGSFSKVDFTVGSEANAVAVADLDGDGKPDLAISNSGESTLSILRNTSTPGAITAGSFATRVTITEIIGTGYVRVGDLDADGKPDLVAGLTNALENKVIVHKNNSTPGTISFAVYFALYTNYLPPQDICISDFDGDSRPDLAAISNGYFSLFRNVGTPGTLQLSSFAVRQDMFAGEIINVMAAGDLSHEGKPDVVISDANSNIFHVRKNTTGYSPIISGFLPTSARKGATVTVSGQYFNETLERNKLLFNNTSATITSVTPTQIVALVPTGPTTGTLKLTSDDRFAESSSSFTLIPAPVVSSFSPASGRAGVEVTIFGNYFDITPANNIVKVGSLVVPATSSTNSQIKFTIPIAAVTGNVSVTVSTDETIGGVLTVIPAPVISSFSPVEGPPGTTVTFTGEYFDPIATRNSVKFNGVTSLVLSSSTNSITAKVPPSATTGRITIQIEAVIGTSAEDFVVTVVTGDTGFDNLDGLSLFPNPADKELTLSMEHFENGAKMDVLVFDVLGNKITELSAIGGSRVSLDVSAFSNGLYVVRVLGQASAVSRIFLKK